MTLQEAIAELTEKYPDQKIEPIIAIELMKAYALKDIASQLGNIGIAINEFRNNLLSKNYRTGKHSITVNDEN